ncbi:MarR family winged helix-turn-helix transcriptional regulator [Vibrio marinisediminis]|nr:MarR family transcriptional regulator [Vibrio marinisediminis]
MKSEIANNLFISLGIVNQLTESLLVRHLVPFGITPSQFTILTHFLRHRDEAQTISELAKVMQMNQPGLTKVINKLHQMDMLDIEKDLVDGRKKWIRINAYGVETVQAAYVSFTPVIDEIFAQWDENEMQQTLEKIDKLKVWLDTNRA